MSTSYLDLTNELLRELNEVTLTSGNFTTAIGVQQHVKDSLNRAYFDIINEEPQWPFLSAAESGDVDPMYGNTYVETVAGTRFYELKPASDNITTDYGSIDWDNFYITTVGVNGETAPYTGNNLSFMTTETWKTFRRPDSRKFGLSPIPDKVYKVWFYAWVLPTKLAAYSDTLVFPEMYSSVLLARARYYIWQFKDNPQAAAFAMEDYKKGLRSMRSNLIESAPTIIQDDRVRFV